MGEWRGIVADVERCATARGRSRLGCTCIEGLRLLERALRAEARIERCVVAESLLHDPREREHRLLDELRAAGVTIHPAPDEVLERLMEGRGGGAVAGLVALPPAPGLEELCRSAGESHPTLLVAVDVEDPGNVGALMRTALASGATGLVCVGLGDPFHPRAVRTSMGAVFKLPVVREDSAATLLDRLDRLGVGTLAAVSEGGTPLPDLPPQLGPLAVFVGSEAFGLPPDAVDRIECRVTVPMSAAVDSLSVNAAAAIVLYELRRCGCASSPRTLR